MSAPRWLFCIAAVCGLGLAGVFAAAPSKPFEERLAAARALVAEGSHALARDAFAQARALAPDATTAVEVELEWIEGVVAAHIAVRDGTEIDAALRRLLDPYRDGARARDAVWARASAAWVASRPWDRRDEADALALEVARYWADQPFSDTNATRLTELVGVLARRVSGRYGGSPNEFSANALAFIREATAAAPAGAVRAERALRLVTATENAFSGDERVRALATAHAAAVAAAAGTSFEAAATLHEAVWLVDRAHNRDMAPAEFDSLLAKVDAALALNSRGGAISEPWALDRLRKRREELVKPGLTLNVAAAYRPDSRVAFTLVAQHRAEATFAVYALTPEEFARSSFDQRVLPRLPQLRHPQPVSSWKVATGVPAGKRGRATRAATVPDDLTPGFYLLATSVGADRSDPAAWSFFVVTAAQVIAHIAPTGDVELSAIHSISGLPVEPIAGAVVRPKSASAFATGADGRTRFTLQSNQNRNDEPEAMVGSADGQPFAVLANFYGQYFDSPWRFHLLTDRALYLSGETARWKLTVRVHEAAGLRNPAGTPVRVTARDDDNNEVIGRWDVTLGALGTASGELVLPAALVDARVNFEVQVLGASPKVEESVEAFRVARFRAPEALLRVTSSTTAGTPGRLPDSVELTARATYFSGEPMAGANVEIAGTFVPDFFATRFEASERRYFPFQRKAVTDAAGVARVSVPVPSGLSSTSDLRVSVNLSRSGTSATATHKLRLSKAGYFAKLQPAGWDAPLSKDDEPRFANLRASKPGEPFTLALQTLDGADAPVAATGELLVRQLSWDEVWRSPEGEFLTGFALRAEQATRPTWPPRDGDPARVWEKLRGEWQQRTIERVNLATDATGAIRHATPPLAAGRYEITFHPPGAATDDEPLAALNLIVADATTRELPASPDDPLRVVPLDPALVPGQPIRALVIMPKSDRRLFVNLATATTHQSKIEQVAGNVKLIEFPWRDEAWSGARFEVGVLASEAENRDYESMVLAPAPATHAANVVLTPASTRPKPGEKTRLTARATDAAGKPVAGEIAFVAADAALASLEDRTPPSAVETLLRPQRIPRSSRTFSADPVFLGPRPSKLAQVTDKDGDTVLLEQFAVTMEDRVSFAAASSLAGSRINAVGVVEAGGAAEPRVRSNFSYTAAWFPEVQTDAAGEATIEFTYPDNLTAWQIDATAVTADNRFGTARITTRTSLPLQSRLRMPRALVAGDTADLTGVFVNARSDAATVRAELSLSGGSAVVLRGDTARSAPLPASGEASAEWGVRAAEPGETTVRLIARTEHESDAMELKLPVRDDGIVQQTGVAGRVVDRAVTLAFTLPKPLDPARTTVEVELSPGVVPALVEALPYLVDYPYGCVEQTMSRFLPAVVVNGLSRDLGFTAAEVEQQLRARRAAAKRTDGAGLNHLDDVIAQSLDRLRSAQHEDGSFSWWPDGPTDPYMTGYVLRGLNIAALSGIKLPGELHRNTFDAVLSILEEGDSPMSVTDRVWLLAAAAAYPEVASDKQQAAMRVAFDVLYEKRAELTPAGLALLLKTAHALERRVESAVLLRNLENGVTRKRTAELGDTAQWGATRDYFRGIDSAIETTALCLEALLAVNPNHPLIDPAAQWLLVNRQSGRWTNTRDTALAVLALHAYAERRGDTVSDASFDLTLNGRALPRRTFTRASMLAPATFTLDVAQLRAGENKLVLKRSAGRGPGYATVVARSWARGDAVKPAGDFLKASRTLTRLVAQPTQLGTVKLTPVALAPGEQSVGRDDRVEVRLRVEVAHDLEYVMIAAPKPGGCEPLNPLSGWDARLVAAGAGDAARDEGTPVYREEHDDRSVFFLSSLPAGTWEIRYTLRAAFTGDYRLLPVTAEAMYVPVIAANGAASRVRVSR